MSITPQQKCCKIGSKMFKIDAAKSQKNEHEVGNPPKKMGQI